MTCTQEATEVSNVTAEQRRTGTLRPPRGVRTAKGIEDQIEQATARAEAALKKAKRE
jgi:hypothetical protein